MIRTSGLALLWTTGMASLTFALEAPPEQAAPKDFGFLGIQTEPKTPGDPKGGIVVTYVNPASSAKEMGFQVGDEILTLNDMMVSDRETFVDALRKENVNAKLRFRLRRGGETIPLTGRIGSYVKTMKAFQEMLRKAYVGKPFPELPALTWWDPEAKRWAPQRDDWGRLRGKVAVVFSFDDCPSCTEVLLQRIADTKEALSSAALAGLVTSAGIYYDERPGKAGKDACAKSAEALFLKVQPNFPVAVAHYPEDKVSAQGREKQFLIHNHGVVVLDSKGVVKYLQILGRAGSEFSSAYKAEIAAAQGGAAATPQGSPEAKP